VFAEKLPELHMFDTEIATNFTPIKFIYGTWKNSILKSHLLNHKYAHNGLFVEATVETILRKLHCNISTEDDYNYKCITYVHSLCHTLDRLYMHNGKLPSMSKICDMFNNLIAPCGDIATNLDLYSCIFGLVNAQSMDFLRKDIDGAFVKPYTIIEEALEDKRRQYKDNITKINPDFQRQILGENLNSLPIIETYSTYPNENVLTSLFLTFNN
jgi:hypothetical protein